MKKRYIAYYRVGSKQWQFQVRAYNHEATLTSELYNSKAAMLKEIDNTLTMDIQEVKETKNRNHEDFDIND
jgi:uncharacterized protein YegP (UPF0339 family)